MTGVRPSEKRFNDFSTRASVDAPNAIPLNQIFKENGYETISYGKIYHHNDDFAQHWTEKDGGADQARVAKVLLCPSTIYPVII